MAGRISDGGGARDSGVRLPARRIALPGVVVALSDDEVVGLIKPSLGVQVVPGSLYHRCRAHEAETESALLEISFMGIGRSYPVSLLSADAHGGRDTFLDHHLELLATILDAKGSGGI